MSTVKALVISPEGIAAVVNIEPTLEKLQAAVGGGYVEYIEGRGWIAYCDEDGKVKGLPVNAAATTLAIENGWRPAFEDFLVGNVVFFGPYGPDEQYNDVPQRLVDQVRSILTN